MLLIMLVRIANDPANQRTSLGVIGIEGFHQIGKGHLLQRSHDLLMRAAPVGQHVGHRTMLIPLMQDRVGVILVERFPGCLVHLHHLVRGTTL